MSLHHFFSTISRPSSPKYPFLAMSLGRCQVITAGMRTEIVVIINGFLNPILSELERKKTTAVKFILNGAIDPFCDSVFTQVSLMGHANSNVLKQLYILMAAILETSVGVVN